MKDGEKYKSLVEKKSSFNGEEREIEKKTAHGCHKNHSKSRHNRVCSEVRDCTVSTDGVPGPSLPHTPLTSMLNRSTCATITRFILGFFKSSLF